MLPIRSNTFRQAAITISSLEFSGTKHRSGAVLIARLLFYYRSNCSKQECIRARLVTIIHSSADILAQSINLSVFLENATFSHDESDLNIIYLVYLKSLHYYQSTRCTKIAHRYWSHLKLCNTWWNSIVPLFHQGSLLSYRPRAIKASHDKSSKNYCWMVKRTGLKKNMQQIYFIVSLNLGFVLINVTKTFLHFCYQKLISRVFINTLNGDQN